MLKRNSGFPCQKKYEITANVIITAAVQASDDKIKSSIKSLNKKNLCMGLYGECGPFWSGWIDVEKLSGYS